MASVNALPRPDRLPGGQDFIRGIRPNYEISAEWAEKLLAALTHVSRRSGAVYLLTTSRRTSAETRRRLDERTAANPAFLYREFPGITPNSHYLGILGLSSVLLVTEDSINMVSESCSSGRPVVVLGVGRRKKRLVFDETIARLEADGCCTYLPAEQMEQLPAVIERARARTPHILNEAERCTREILRMLTQNAS